MSGQLIQFVIHQFKKSPNKKNALNLTWINENWTTTLKWKTIPTYQFNYKASMIVKMK